MEELRPKIKEMLASKVGMEAVDLEEELLLKEDLGMTASDIADFMAELESSLKIKIPDEEMSALLTLGDLISAAETHEQEF